MKGLLGIAASTLIIGLAGCPSSNLDTVYNIGDTGPAGGIVFYDQGSIINGWRYLEAAPSDADPAPWWGATTKPEKTGANKTLIGDGKANTATIVSAQGAAICAASVCTSFVLNSYNDWFLPDSAEVDQFRNLFALGRGNIGGPYWCSDELSLATANQGTIDSSGSHFVGVSKNSILSVRPVREFQVRTTTP